jgi:catechol 2,3-dioxygenase-like lactoylglutathione lyase family enzyme
MFTSTPAFSGFSVDDTEAARAFYGGTLGLATSDEMGMLVLQLGGGGTALVYPKDDHVPAAFTVLNSPVDDITRRAARGLDRAGRHVVGSSRRRPAPDLHPGAHAAGPGGRGGREPSGHRPS